MGPLPPPYIGPAVATDILLNSKLKDNFEIIHLNTNTHQSIETLAKIRFKSLLKNLQLYFRLFLLLVRSKPILVLIPISQTTIGFVKDSFFIFISWLFRKKILIQLRGSNWKNWLKESSGLTNWYVNMIMGLATGGIVLGNKLKYLFEGYLPSENIFSISNGCNIKLPEFSIQKNKNFNMIYIGNFFPSKGIFDIMKSLKIINNTEVISNQLIAIGEWQNSQIKFEYIEYCNQNNLNIKFLNKIYGNEKIRRLKNSDLFLFTPREPEGHPWVIVEAMAAGLPIISTDQGAITESVIDGVNGFIVEKKNPNQIAEKIKLLMKDEKLRLKMGQESRRFYEEKFTEEIMVMNYLNTFNKVIYEK